MSDFFQQYVQNLLSEMELGDDIVLCGDSERISKKISDSILQVMPNTTLTLSDMQAVRALILLAVADPRFFDSDMPSLTGLTASGFRDLAEKLPKG